VLRPRALVFRLPARVWTRAALSGTGRAGSRRHDGRGHRARRPGPAGRRGLQLTARPAEKGGLPAGVRDGKASFLAVASTKSTMKTSARWSSARSVDWSRSSFRWCVQAWQRLGRRLLGTRAAGIQRAGLPHQLPGCTRRAELEALDRDISWSRHKRILQLLEQAGGHQIAPHLLDEHTHQQSQQQHRHGSLDGLAQVRRFELAGRAGHQAKAQVDQ
jgi:hypothetical protein